MAMSDPPRRSILKLKLPPATPAAPAPEAAPEVGAGTRWTCKPCGAVLVITGQESADQEIRCPVCNARLGVAGDSLIDGGSKLRARRLPPLRTGA